MGDWLLTPTLDRLISDQGWTTLRAGETFDTSLLDDAFVVGAVAWSTWDVEALRSLATYLPDGVVPHVVVFNMDDIAPDDLSLLLPDVKPYAVPVICRFVGGEPIRTEQGMPAVNWMRELAVGSA